MADETTNYHFTLPTDGDPVDQTPFNTNFTIIDGLLKANADGIAAVTPTRSTATITSASLETTFEGTIAGELDTDITGGAAAMGGVVRAYKYSNSDVIQIAEAIDGTRVTRYFTNSTWSIWT